MRFARRYGTGQIQNSGNAWLYEAMSAENGADAMQWLAKEAQAAGAVIDDDTIKKDAQLDAEIYSSFNSGFAYFSV